ncbi:response regulator transcription factor [Paraburkholderia pallida]|uniref:Response regulator transcription factor n=1 Tax=Paraburkholderia pallida TaxID=2547399 RepID=A0A4P7D8J2_9BURK|nr:response regulator [Paraburkholderia pallida]QBR03737.1 response regulator transcription factor [Paraburkholderia pallida]
MPAISHSTSTTSESNTSIVYVVDDDESMRQSLSNLLSSVGLRVEVFESSQQFLAFPKLDVPSCLILDVRLRGESGLTFQQNLLRTGLTIPILFMTGFGDMEMSVKAMKAGAVDFLPKPFRQQDMLDAVTQALAKDEKRIVAEHAAADLRVAYASLTLREQQVMALVVTGLLNKQIASELNLSEITVKVHRAQAMKKMTARSLADLIHKADALGLNSQMVKPS